MHILLKDRESSREREIRNPFGEVNPDDLPLLVVGRKVYRKTQVAYGGGCWVTFEKCRVKRIGEQAARPLTEAEKPKAPKPKAPRKPKPITLQQFRKKMAYYGLCRVGGEGQEQWAGRSKSGRWTVTITGEQQCNVDFLPNGGRSSFDKGATGLSYAEALNKVDTHGIYFAD